MTGTSFQRQEGEPYGTETIACFATAPVRRPMPEHERKIVEEAIAKARADAQKEREASQPQG